MVSSRNYLGAFTSTLKRSYNEAYASQYMSQKEYEQLINTSMEKGSTGYSTLGIDLGESSNQ